MASPRYLIGQGEALSEDIARAPRGSGDKAHPYSFGEARRRLAGQWQETSAVLRGLPDLACPGGDAAIELTLHPSYLAKSYYPGFFVRELGLLHLGSRATHIVPSRVVSSRANERGQAQPAPVLYLGGRLESIMEFGAVISDWLPSDTRVENDFRKIESVAPPRPDRFKGLSDRFADRDEVPLEVVLHTPDTSGRNGDVVPAFEAYLQSLTVWHDLNLVRYAGGLAFVPIRAQRERFKDILAFTYLRTMREVPRIIPFDPTVRSTGSAFPVTLPIEDATASDLSVAIFDGGLPAGHGLSRWVTLQDAPGVGAPIPAAQRHGLAVNALYKILGDARS